jgi:hypothetical protein
MDRDDTPGVFVAGLTHAVSTLLLISIVGATAQKCLVLSCSVPTEELQTAWHDLHSLDMMFFIFNFGSSSIVSGIGPFIDFFLAATCILQ